MIGVLIISFPIQHLQSTDETIPEVLISKPEDSHLLQLVTALTEQAHYSKKNVTNELSPFILVNFLEELDPSKMYFTKSDFHYFQRYRYQIDDALKQGKLEPIFDIFRIYRLRVQQRLEFCMNFILKKKDFNTDDYYDFDRNIKDWSNNEIGLKSLWQGKVQNDLLMIILAGQTQTEAVQILNKRYSRFVKTVNSYKKHDVINIFLNAYVQTLDPHSIYFDPLQAEEYEIQMSLSYQGIGARLNMENELVNVVDVIPGSPASKDGRLKSGDKITGILDQKNKSLIDVIGWNLNEVVKLIRGPQGSEVTLQIMPLDSNLESPYLLTLKRDEVQLEDQAASSVIEELQMNDRTYSIGIITIPSFYQDFRAKKRNEETFRSTSEDVKEIVDNLMEIGIDALLIDLRGNGGGLLTEATALTGLFIDDGPVVQLKDSRNKIEIIDDPISGSIYKGPLAVMVDRFSASASEIFAGAIQDYSRGIVIGQQTFGKGTVQSIYPLDRFSRFKSKNGFGQLTLTIGKFYRISGSGTQNRGVVPDIELPSFINKDRFGEETKKNTLPWDRITSLKYDHDLSLDKSIALLQDKYSQRSKNNLPLKFLKEDIDSIKIQNQNTRLSLNLDIRINEREQIKIANQERRTKRLEQLGYADNEDFDDFVSKTLLNEVLKMMVDLIDYNDPKPDDSQPNQPFGHS
ncbi:MAG TPA: carboxy terminal-processing peptidase [Gammaproteobacteria bacterium]|nr:carboxy terminal-processing peptidase [Gammaproteobacteria bacterium]